MFIIVLVNSKLEECSWNANFAGKHGAYIGQSGKLGSSSFQYDLQWQNGLQHYVSPIEKIEMHMWSAEF